MAVAPSASSVQGPCTSHSGFWEADASKFYKGCSARHKAKDYKKHGDPFLRHHLPVLRDEKNCSSERQSSLFHSRPDPSLVAFCPPHHTALTGDAQGGLMRSTAPVTLLPCTLDFCPGSESHLSCRKPSLPQLLQSNLWLG